MSPHLLLSSLLFLLGAVISAAAPKAPIHVALIFDDGPHAEQTPKLLALFAEEGIRVTFGTIGRNAEARPAVLRQAVAAGHEIANHSFAHQNPRGLSPEAVEREVADGQSTITAAAGLAPVWYWPPYIAIDEQVRASVARAGLKIFAPRKLVASGDYLKEVDAAELFRRSTTGIEDGTVILFHEWRPETATQLPAIIAELRRQGCVFHTFSDLAAQPVP